MSQAYAPELEEFAPSEAERNSVGVVGLVLSIVGILTAGVLSPIALIVSVIGLFKPPRLAAIIGTVLSGIGCVLLAVVAVIAIGALTYIRMDYQVQKRRSQIQAEHTQMQRNFDEVDRAFELSKREREEALRKHEEEFRQRFEQIQPKLDMSEEELKRFSDKVPNLDPVALPEDSELEAERKRAEDRLKALAKEFEDGSVGPAAPPVPQDAPALPEAPPPPDVPAPPAPPDAPPPPPALPPPPPRP